MKAQAKRAFYPSEEIEKELKVIPRGHLSERVNELIRKGLSAEKQEQVALAYQQYDASLEKRGHKPIDLDSANDFMAGRAFQPEDEIEGFI